MRAARTVAAVDGLPAVNVCYIDHKFLCSAMPLKGLVRRGGTFKYHYSVHIDKLVLREGVPNPPGTITWCCGKRAAESL